MTSNGLSHRNTPEDVAPLISALDSFEEHAAGWRSCEAVKRLVQCVTHIEILACEDSRTMLQAFCDASGIFDHRFQSIGAVSGNAAVLSELRAAVDRVAKECKIREIKFAEITRLDSPDYRAAVSTITLSVDGYCRHRKCRIDVMTWDTTDSRHAVPGRDDSANLARLYYHLLLHVIKRWPADEWNVLVDKDEKVNFSVLKECLNYNSAIPGPGGLPMIVETTSQLAELDPVKAMGEVDSDEEPLIQIADLFAGIGRYSCEHGEECCRWLASKGNPDQLPLADFDVAVEVSQDYSRSMECRFQLIGQVDKMCKRHRLGVSLGTERRLWTPNPENPVNFWYYRPQSDYDKAPTA